MSKELSQEIHNNANQFITWLREAEEEEESGDDSDDDVEVNILFIQNILYYLFLLKVLI